MVEKLKIAIEKARAQRGDGTTAPLRPKGTVGGPVPVTTSADAAAETPAQPAPQPAAPAAPAAAAAPLAEVAARYPLDQIGDTGGLDDAELAELGRSPEEETAPAQVVGRS